MEGVPGTGGDGRGDPCSPGHTSVLRKLLHNPWGALTRWGIEARPGDLSGVVLVSALRGLWDGVGVRELQPEARVQGLEPQWTFVAGVLIVVSPISEGGSCIYRR